MSSLTVRIVYNEVQFPVDPSKFCEKSSFFNEIYDPKYPDAIHLTGKPPAEHFGEFISFINGKPMRIHEKNYESLLVFANEWDVGELKEEIASFIDVLEGPMGTLNSLRSLSKNDKNRENLEARMASFGLSGLSLPGIESLGINCVTRIINHPSFPPVSPQDLFDLLFPLFESKGSAVFDMFSRIPLSQLSNESVKKLLSVSKSDSKILTKELISYSSSLLEKLKDLRQEKESENQELREKIAMANKDLYKAKKEVKAANSVLQKDEVIISEHIETSKRLQLMLTQTKQKLNAHKQPTQDTPAPKANPPPSARKQKKFQQNLRK